MRRSEKINHMLRLGLPRCARPLRVPRLAVPLAVRHNSSAPEIKTTLTDFSQTQAVADALPTTTLHSDQLGYLQSIGLADGWGPTALLERLLEVTHVYTGLPWWATIVCTTIAVRTVMFPIYVKLSANMAKMSKVKPELDQLMNDIRSGDNEEKMVAMRRRNKLYKEHDIKTSHLFLPILQLPVAYGFFQATRKMAAAPVEGFADQGAYWFENLTQVDPYLGLQIATACIVTGMLRSGGETGAATMNPMMKRAMTVLPWASIFITYNMSAAVLLYFTANALFSLVQSLVLKNKAFRKFAKIPPILPPIPVPGAKPPPATFSEWFADFNAKIKTQSHSKMQKTSKQLEVMEKRRDSANEGFIKRH